MHKSDLPTTFGIFNPVGHTVIAFLTEAELESAQSRLQAMGFAQPSMVRYSAIEMLTQADAELLNVSPAATFGYELDLIRAHKALASRGCCFLIIEAQTSALASLVADLVRSIKPASAQHYGSIMIQDLTEGPPGRMKS